MVSRRGRQAGVDAWTHRSVITSATRGWTGDLTHLPYSGALHPSAFVHWHAETLIGLAGILIS